MLIRRWMTKEPITIEPGHTLAQAKSKMEKGGFRRLPVTANGALVGIITDRDLRQHAGAHEHTRVDVAMTAPVITVTPDMVLDQAANLFAKHKVGGFPVLEHGKLVGIITAIDMMRAFGQVLGTGEEGVSRIDLAFTGSSFDLAMIAELVGLSSGEVLGMGSYKGGHKGQTVYVRVRSDDAKRIAGMLDKNNFIVLGIHQ